MATVLVTGGAGYIGSVCCAQLIQSGHEVLVVDDLSTGYKEAIPAAVPFYQADIRDEREMRRILAEHPVDVVFHFAAKALIPESMSNPGLFFDENVAAGIRLLEELRRAKVHRIVFSSSAAVYGNPDKIPILEDDPKVPMNSYGETKLMFEQILAWYVRAYGWGVAALRYFNACGACGSLGERHEPETHIIPLLLQAAAGETEVFKIYGTDYPTPDGTCLRDYVHVLDIADAHIRTMSLLDSPGMYTFNIGTGCSYSVRQVMQTVESVTGKRIRSRAKERRQGDPPVLCASPEKLTRTLAWKPIHSDLINIVQTAWAYQQGVRGELSTRSLR
jgi:UDP-glucose 4-epimerase